MKVKLIDGSREWVLEDAAGKTIGDVLRRLRLNIEEYIVALKGRVVTTDEIIRDGDEIVLYPVVSGG